MKARQAEYCETALKLPEYSLTTLTAPDLPVVQAWWQALTDVQRSEVLDVLIERESLPTFSIELEDERLSDYLDEDQDRYDYLVNHEFRATGLMMFDSSVPLPGIALLAPLWPPYSVADRYQSWRLSSVLYSQLSAEWERHERGQPKREETSGYPSTDYWLPFQAD